MPHRKTRSTLAVNFSRVGNYYFSPAPTSTFSRRSAMHCSALPYSDTHHTPVHLLNCLNDGRLQREARSIYDRQLRCQIIHRSEIFNCDSWRFVAIRGCLVRGRTRDANRREICRTAIRSERVGGGGCKLVEVSLVRLGEEVRKAPLVWWCIKHLPRGSIPPRAIKYRRSLCR